MVEYQLHTSSITGDHFYVSFTDVKGDTITNHEHDGWKYSFSTTKPFNAYLKAQVYPIDIYDLTIKILVDGKVVKQTSASTASGANTIISIENKVE